VEAFVGDEIHEHLVGDGLAIDERPIAIEYH
jgi:hypothetical protein